MKTEDTLKWTQFRHHMSPRLETLAGPGGAKRQIRHADSHVGGRDAADGSTAVVAGLAAHSTACFRQAAKCSEFRGSGGGGTVNALQAESSGVMVAVTETSETSKPTRLRPPALRPRRGAGSALKPVAEFYGASVTVNTSHSEVMMLTDMPSGAIVDNGWTLSLRMDRWSKWNVIPNTNRSGQGQLSALSAGE